MENLQLIKDCVATRIPSGEVVTLSRGDEFSLVQALGGSVTLRNNSGLFRIAGDHLDSLGEELKAHLIEKFATEELGGEFSEDLVWQALRQCYDPEIPVNIVDLGLIYDLRYAQLSDGRYDVAVQMTLTATGCGMGPTIAADAKSRIESIPTVRQADVAIVWDPQWSPHMISPEGRKMLGLD
ncbi:MAG: iron-sulfur cluster assembly protein [Verrucomicrobia bacterium]|nr:iron-sulfur cluster assembly protein [Verrucomicrobiota bacterium]